VHKLTDADARYLRPQIAQRAYRLVGNYADAQDLTQETLLKLFRSDIKFRTRTGKVPRPFWTRALLSVFLDRGRYRSCRPTINLEECIDDLGGYED